MATSLDGYVLAPVSKAVGLWVPVSGEHGWEGAVAPGPAFHGQWLVGHCEQSAGLDGPLV